MEKVGIELYRTQLEKILRNPLVTLAAGSPLLKAARSHCSSKPSVTSHFSCQLPLQIYRKSFLMLNLNHHCD